jgi:hypothetical protein
MPTSTTGFGWPAKNETERIWYRMGNMYKPSPVEAAEKLENEGNVGYEITKSGKSPRSLNIPRGRAGSLGRPASRDPSSTSGNNDVPTGPTGPTGSTGVSSTESSEHNYSDSVTISQSQTSQVSSEILGKSSLNHGDYQAKIWERLKTEWHCYFHLTFPEIFSELLPRLLCKGLGLKKA